VAPTLQRAPTASCAGVSATRPRDSYLRTDQLVGVKELERWPNNWGQVNAKSLLRSETLLLLATG
jgi:hypothetical protein